MKINICLLRHSVIALILLALPAAVQAQFNFTTNNGAITITGYTGPGGMVAIPNTTNGYNVTSIGQEAFFGCDTLTNVFIPGSVTNIGPEAFAFCTNLTYAVFAGNAPPDVGNAFDGDPVAIVYYWIASTGWGSTFGGAPTVMYTSDSGFEYEVINGSITIMGDNLIGGAVFIPSIINGYTVTSIEGMQPDGQVFPLSSVIIPTTVTNIGEYAFAGCTGLTNLVVPNSLISIGEGAFEECWSLTNFVLPDSVTSIGAAAFNECYRLTSVVIPENVTNIGEGAFSSCTGLTNISVAAANPAYVSTNGILFDKAYDTLVQYPAGLTSKVYIIPTNVASIEQSAFEDCVNLTSITIPNSVTNIGPVAFESCTRLTNIVIPNGVTSIGTNTFYDCSKLSSVTIPNGVTSIGETAFCGCTVLASITIPSSVTNIGEDAFQDCNLTAAYFEGNAPPDDGTAFANDPDPVVYYLPGTTGWGPTFGGAPTELWNPRAVALYSAGGQFGFYITGMTNATVVVEACTNLANPVWLPVSTNTLSASGASAFSDPQWTNHPNRYYRFSAP